MSSEMSETFDRVDSGEIPTTTVVSIDSADFMTWEHPVRCLVHHQRVIDWQKVIQGTPCIWLEAPMHRSWQPQRAWCTGMPCTPTGVTSMCLNICMCFSLYLYSFPVAGVGPKGSSSSVSALDVAGVVAFIISRPQLAARVGPPGSEAQWTVQEVGDGNINFVFIVQVGFDAAEEGREKAAGFCRDARKGAAVWDRIKGWIVGEACCATV